MIDNDVLVNQAPHDLEAQRLEIERRKLRLKVRKHALERQQAASDSIQTLLSVVQYLNSVQDGAGYRIEETYNRTEIDKRSRILNCHEEDIMNASLITMRRLIESLLPAPRRTAAAPAATDT